MVCYPKRSSDPYSSFFPRHINGDVIQIGSLVLTTRMFIDWDALFSILKCKKCLYKLNINTQFSNSIFKADMFTPDGGTTDALATKRNWSILVSF